MIYTWHTGHEINEKVSQALHAGIPQNVLKHTEWLANYLASPNKYPAIAYGILRGTAEVFAENARHGVTYYEVDRGYINPRHFDGYYRISKNGMQAKYRDIDYPDDRLKSLKYKRADWYNPKGIVLVCPPSDFIENHYHLRPGQWESDVVELLESQGLPFKVRQKSDNTPLEHDLNGARLLCTYNSNVALDAAIKGIPVQVGVNSVLHGWDGANVDKLLRFISYNQFTLEEIGSGLAWRLLHE